MSLTQEIPATSPIGRDTPRVDGPLKVTGKAQYTSDFHFPGMLYAVPVEATIANGRIRQARYERGREDARRARDLSSREHRKDFPLGPGAKEWKASARSGARRSRMMSFATTANTSRWPWRTRSRLPKRLPMRFAWRTTRRSRTSRPSSKPTTIPKWFSPHSASSERLQSQRGDADAAFASAPVKIDQTYVTPAETHNPIELHATTAIWEGSTLTLYDSSQGVVNFRSVLAQMFDLTEGERPRHYQVRGFGFRRQAVSMDALCARRRRGAEVGQAGETRAQP